MITQDKKTEIIDKYRVHSKDTGSTEVQVAILTARVEDLRDHFKAHSKDHHSRRGLLRLVGKRRRLLDYLKGEELDRYKNLIERLGIRK